MSGDKLPAVPGNGKGGRYAEVGGIRAGNVFSALEGLEGPLGEAVIACVCAGDAILFGSTRDKTAVIVRVFSEQGGAEWYEGSSQALYGVLDGIKLASIAP